MTSRRRSHGLCLLASSAAAACALASGHAQDGGPGGKRDGGRGERPPSSFHTEVPEHPGSVILARPTSSSVTVSLLLHAGGEGVLVCGKDPSALPTEGRAVSLAAGVPKPVLVDGLDADARYAYELRDAKTRKRLLPTTGPGTFHTARPAGASFAFTLQADSHLDEGCLPELYERTLANALADEPDFHVDLGDTFMTEKHASRESAAKQYAAQRYYLGRIGQAAPVFLVLGNHDGETLDRSGGAPSDGLAVWSNALRKRLFVNPTPDGFYSGNAAKSETAGELQDYYAWEWGDSLLVALDPYWTSLPTRGGKSPWNATLGDAQYTWLAKTLRASRARQKLVFIHQLTGSYHAAGRGGAEAAVYQEWGGKDLDGGDGFAKNRPGWSAPIHRLLVETGVSVVFHGHDHFYARQELDRIVYQLVPQPAHRNMRNHHAEEYGYRAGDFLPSSGHLRVRVTSASATVEYVRSALPEHERKGLRNQSVAASYVVSPRAGGVEKR